jgi:hypothetical protein
VEADEQEREVVVRAREARGNNIPGVTALHLHNYCRDSDCLHNKELYDYLIKGKEVARSRSS